MAKQARKDGVGRERDPAGLEPSDRGGRGAGPWARRVLLALVAGGVGTRRLGL
jgi:hypothetical protein